MGTTVRQANMAKTLKPTALSATILLPSNIAISYPLSSMKVTLFLHE